MNHVSHHADFIIDGGKVQLLQYQLLPVNLKERAADGKKTQIEAKNVILAMGSRVRELPHIKIERLLCDRQSFIKSRAPLEDNAYVLSHYDNGAVGRLWASSVNAGSMASQRYRFVGSKASVEWTETPGRHDWNTWRDHLARVLPLLFR